MTPQDKNIKNRCQHGQGSDGERPEFALQDVARQVLVLATVRLQARIVHIGGVDANATVWPSSAVASKLTSSSRRSITVDRRRAPMFRCAR